MPRGSEKTDWEVELAVVIGKRARYVSEADAPAHVAGYALHNDYSERQDQLERGGNWSKGKRRWYAPRANCFRCWKRSATSRLPTC